MVSNLRFKIIFAVFTTFFLVLLASEGSRWLLPRELGTFITVGAVLVSFVFLFWFLARQLEPLRRLVVVAQKIAGGDLKARVDTDLQDEVGDLARAFNRMLDALGQRIAALEQANKSKNEFLAITAHNLQTPLVVLKGYVEKLAEEGTLNNHQRETLEHLKKTIEHLRQINSRLLSTVELQGAPVVLNRKRGDLAIVAARVVKDFRKRAAAKKINLEFKAAREPLTCEFDEEWIKVVFENLLDNAIKFTPEEGRVTVRIGKTKEGQIFGEVEDTGIGIPQKEQKAVLEPFHRAQRALSGDYEGIGLGLYIVRLVIDKHNGKIEIDSEEGRGTRIRFLLPPAELEDQR